MSFAYVDTSFLMPIAFAEPGAATLAVRLAAYEKLVAADLLQAELRSACARERVTPPDDIIATIGWILPDRALNAEVQRVLAAGYVRGADAYHLAAGLYFRAGLSALKSFSFLTLDRRQSEVARALGFDT